MSPLFVFYFIIFDGNLSFYLFAVDDDEHTSLGAIENDGVGGDVAIKQSRESVQTGPWYLVLASQPWPFSQCVRSTAGGWGAKVGAKAGSNFVQLTHMSVVWAGN